MYRRVQGVPEEDLDEPLAQARCLSCGHGLASHRPLSEREQIDKEQQDATYASLVGTLSWCGRCISGILLLLVV